MKKSLSVLLLLSAGIYSQFASAATTTINCPLSKVRVEMSTNLPSGWWRTPYVNNLKSTAISKVGGKNTLICKYGNHAAFWTMRLVPRGNVCKPSNNTGFICKSKIKIPPKQKPVTYKTGPLVIPQTYQADLDSGSVRSEGADIWFQAQTAIKRYVTPRNGASLAIAGRRSINLAGCKRLSYRNQSIALSSIPEGTYVCVKTNQGRYSQFRVNRAVGASPGILHIGYTTWKK